MVVFTRDQVHELGDVFTGKATVLQPPRGQAGGIIYYKNNSGLAIRFAPYAVTKIFAHLMGFDVEVISGYKGSSDYTVATARGDGDACVGITAVLRPDVDGGMLELMRQRTKKSRKSGRNL
jgi:hypothetical protein